MCGASRGLSLACVTSQPLSLPHVSLGPKTEGKLDEQARLGGTGNVACPQGRLGACPRNSEQPSPVLRDAWDTARRPLSHTEPGARLAQHCPRAGALPPLWGSLVSPAPPLSYASGSFRTVPVTPASRSSPGLRSSLSTSQMTSRGPVVVLLSPWMKWGEQHPNSVGLRRTSAKAPRLPASTSSPLPGVCPHTVPGPILTDSHLSACF